MNISLFKLVIERVMSGKDPIEGHLMRKNSEAWPWVVAFFASLLPLVTNTEFINKFWWGVAFSFVVVSGYFMVINLYQLCVSRGQRGKTTEMIVQEICEQIEQDNQRVAKLNRKLDSDKEESQ